MRAAALDVQEELDTELVQANVRPPMVAAEVGTLARLFNKLDPRHRGFIDMTDVDLWCPGVCDGSPVFEAFMRWVVCMCVCVGGG